jgi:hypothetical protein
MHGKMLGLETVKHGKLRCYNFTHKFLKGKILRFDLNNPLSFIDKKIFKTFLQPKIQLISNINPLATDRGDEKRRPKSTLTGSSEP